jgi:hypothetical protein
MSEAFNQIATRLGVDPSALRGLYEEMVEADTGSSYADLSTRLSAQAEAPDTSARSEEEEVAAFNAQLAQAWNVEPDVVNSRLEQLNNVFVTLPKAQQETYASVDGIQALWNVVNASQPAAPQQAAPQSAAQPTADGVVTKGATLSGISPATLLTNNSRAAQFEFDALVDMPEAEYAKIASNGTLLAAFNAGRVKDTELALFPEHAQRPAIR